MRYTRSRNVFDPTSDKPYKLSRSKLELFVKCARCFYLDRRLGIGQPPTPPFNLNSAVDALLKKEFDYYRAKGEPHPMMTQNKIRAVPFQHEQMDYWRDALRGGISHHHVSSNFTLHGGIDDLWINEAGELIIVDYKATAKADRVNLDSEWQNSYKRQLSIYGWLFEKSGFKVAKLGYFVYCNGKLDRPRFDSRLEFDISVLGYELDGRFIDDTLDQAKACLLGNTPPDYSPGCEHCGYQQALKVIDSSGVPGASQMDLF